MQFRARKNASENIPEIEEKFVRAIIGKSIAKYEKATLENDKAAIDSASRTLERVNDLLTKISTGPQSKSWIWELRATFDEVTGNFSEVLDHSMKEYRSILSIAGWETDIKQVSKMVELVLKISQMLKKEGSRSSLMKSKMMLNGVVKKICSAYFEKSEIPAEVSELEALQNEIETLMKKTKNV